MATLATEMPPLHTAESLAGVTTPASTQPSAAVSGGGGVGGTAVVTPQTNTAIDSTQSNETDSNPATGGVGSGQTTAVPSSHTPQTISAAADSSDNQPGTPQPLMSNGNNGTDSNATNNHHPYANHHMYANSQTSTTSAGNSHMNQMYPHHIYSQSNMDMQQQQQQQQQQLQSPLTPSQHSNYPSYLNSYEQFYQQQQQQQQQQQNPSQSSGNTAQNPNQMDFINSNSNSSLYGSSSSDYKQQSGVRYHPYLHTPTSGIPSSHPHTPNGNNALDANAQTAPVVSSASSSVMSPRVVSSTSPSSSSNQMPLSGSASSIGSLSAGNPNSPNSGVSTQCKKCGIMCTNESELQEHIANVHGASPYGSSGYASSPYIKEEMQQQTPPSQSQQQAPNGGQSIPGQQQGNPGEILDLDSQKMLYPPAPGSMAALMHQPLPHNDPLQGLHTMQQRAGMSSWDQQSQEGLPPYMQQGPTGDSKSLPNHSPYYHQSPKQSPYHVTQSSQGMKTDYPGLIKNEYPPDTQQYMGDKSFDPTAPQGQQQQQMMPPAVSSSPAEFPSTTTGGPQDMPPNAAGNPQQFRASNFEPPSSSSAALTTGALGGKAANWKSNEARRPKTYNCTACNKWFTSSGHLKRHYNTTLHKNAVKSSGQPDPATLPISAHHHPARDPNGKAGRRSQAHNNNNNQQQQQQQQQQQAPNPVQPPEPPHSPHDYGGSQVAAGGLTPLQHYAATPSPNSMYQQQQYQQQQQQYMPQVNNTTNASPQHASSMVNSHQQHMSQNQQTVMNGHPNALAGPSVPTTQQQTPMPSSPMRGLLTNTNNTPQLTNTMHSVKNEHLEAAIMEQQQQDLQHHQQQQELAEQELQDPQQDQLDQEEEDQLTEEEEVEELGYLTMPSAKQEYLVKEDQVAYSPKPHVKAELLEDHPQEDQEQQHHHNPPGQVYQLDQAAELERLYHNTTPSSTHSNSHIPLPTHHSPLIISHQQYQEQLQQQQQHQMLTQQDHYTLTQTPTPPPPQQQPLSIMEQQPPYINMPPLAINTQQPPNNMLQLQPLDTITPTTPTIHTPMGTNMAHMLTQQPNLHMQLTDMQPLPQQQQHNTPQQQQLDTNNINIPHMLPTPTLTPTSNITTIPSYHQLQQQPPQPGSVLPQLEHTLTYPHTIIGNSLGNAEVLTLDAYGNLVSANGQQQQVIQTADGQLVQLIPAGATSLYSSQSYHPYMAQRSPQEGDLPPLNLNYQQELGQSLTYSNHLTPIQETVSEQDYKPSLTEDYLNNNFQQEQEQQQQQDLNENKQEMPTEAKQIANNNTNSSTPNTTTTTTSTTTSNKRKRNPSTSSSIGANSTMLPSGRIKCLPCDKEFTKICYLTQHNKSFHSGEYPFRCQKCGKRYQTEDVYITHLGKHKTTDKAHKCDICPKQFHHKTDLRRHIEAIHTGNKQHSCDICEKSFCRKDHLRKHLETHNRPRIVTKKSTNRNSSNNSITNAFAKLQTKTKSKDSVEIKEQLPLKSPEGSSTSSASSPALNNQMNSLNPLNNHLIETNSLSSTNTPSPLMHHIDDVAADDDELLEDELDELEENEEYLTMAEYEQQIQQQMQTQYTLGKQQVYQMVEQELPMY